MAHGVDTSEHQGALDWPEMASHEAFAIIKITDGLTYFDNQARRSIVECQRIGLPIALYHWGHPENRPTVAGAEAEAHHFCNTAESYGFRPGQLTIEGRRCNGGMLDIEGAAPKQVAHVLGWWSRRWGEVVAERWGPHSGIYSYASYFNETSLGELRHEPSLIRWIAAYGSSWPDGANLHQHTDRHLGRNLDGNVGDVVGSTGGPVAPKRPPSPGALRAMFIYRASTGNVYLYDGDVKEYIQDGREWDQKRWTLARSGVQDVFGTDRWPDDLIDEVPERLPDGRVVATVKRW